MNPELTVSFNQYQIFMTAPEYKHQAVPSISLFYIILFWVVLYFISLYTPCLSTAMTSGILNPIFHFLLSSLYCFLLLIALPFIVHYLHPTLKQSNPRLLGHLWPGACFYLQKNSLHFHYSLSSHLFSAFTSTANARHITVVCKKLDTISKAELHNLLLAVFICLLYRLELTSSIFNTF